MKNDFMRRVFRDDDFASESKVERNYIAGKYRNKVNEEQREYNLLLSNQNNLLDRINTPEIRIWRYGNQLYYRTNAGQLIIGNQVEIKKELSSRYGADIDIVNDLNDVLNDNKVRTNTIIIAINNLHVVEEEYFTLNRLNEIYHCSEYEWNRNLLASTRFLKQRLKEPWGGITYIHKLMTNVTEKK